MHTRLFRSSRATVFIGSGPGPFGPSRNDCIGWGIGAKTLAYYVYLLASRRHGTLYLGITNDLARRVGEHRAKIVPGFTAKYGVERLVWFELTTIRLPRSPEKRPSRNGGAIGKLADRGAEPDWHDLFPAIA